MKNFNKIILSLGSNIGDKKSNLETAIIQIDKFSTIKVITIVQSVFYILSICLAYLFMIKNTKIKDNIN